MNNRIIILLLFMGVIAGASPVSTFTWTPPVQYEDGSFIPVDDILTFKLYCSPTSGGPYDVSWDMGTISTAIQDVVDCVQGTPGTYYFVATAFSTAHQLESDYSNEVSKFYSSLELGKIPRAPQVLSVQ